MKILVTGSTGFIGRHLHIYYPELVKTVRFSSLDVEGGESKGVFISSILKDTEYQEQLYDINSIIHLAGLAHSSSYTAEEYQEVNVEGTLKLAMAAAKARVKRFVFVSSINVSGTSTFLKPFSTTSFSEPKTDYACSKYEAELGLKKISQETGLEIVIVRPTLVYGPCAPGNFGMLTSLINKLPLLPFGLANNRRDFIAVQNLADLLVTCAKHPAAAGRIFLASDRETVSIKEFTNAIAKGLGKKVFQLPIPITLMHLAGKLFGKSDMIEQLYGNLEVDSSNLKDVLGWTPPLTMKQAMGTLRDTGAK